MLIYLGSLKFSFKTKETRQICFVHDTIYRFDDQINYFEAQTLPAVSFDVMSEDCTASGIDQMAEIIHNVDLKL